MPQRGSFPIAGKAPEIPFPARADHPHPGGRHRFALALREAQLGPFYSAEPAEPGPTGRAGFLGNPVVGADHRLEDGPAAVRRDPATLILEVGPVHQVQQVALAEGWPV